MLPQGLSTAATNHVHLQTNRAPRSEHTTTEASPAAQKALVCLRQGLQKSRKDTKLLHARRLLRKANSYFSWLEGPRKVTSLRSGTRHGKSLTAVCGMTSAGVLAAVFDSRPVDDLIPREQLTRSPHSPQYDS